MRIEFSTKLRLKVTKTGFGIVLKIQTRPPAQLALDDLSWKPWYISLYKFFAWVVLFSLVEVS